MEMKEKCCLAASLEDVFNTRQPAIVNRASELELAFHLVKTSLSSWKKVTGIINDKQVQNAKLLADLAIHMIIKNDLICLRKKQRQLSSYPWMVS